jgi:hypothetical protein
MSDQPLITCSGEVIKRNKHNVVLSRRACRALAIKGTDRCRFHPAEVVVPVSTLRRVGQAVAAILVWTVIIVVGLWLLAATTVANTNEHGHGLRVFGVVWLIVGFYALMGTVEVLTWLVAQVRRVVRHV